MNLSRILDPSLLERVVLGLSIEQWLLLAAGIAGTFLLLYVFRHLLARRLARLERLSTTTTRTVAGLILHRTRAYFLLALSLTLSAYLIGWGPRGKALVLGLLGLAALFQVGRWGDALIALWSERTQRRRRAEQSGSVALVSLMGVLGRVALWVVIGLVLMDNLGVDVTTLIAGLGIGGIAIAFGLQSVFADLFAALSIMLDRPFAIGDLLALGEHLGTVEYIGLKTTRLRGVGGEEIIFANATLLEREVRNFGRMRERRVVLRIGVTYETSHETLQEIPGIVRAIIEERPETRVEYGRFLGHGDWALKFEFVYFVLNPSYARYLEIQESVGLAMHRVFEERGIDFAFPTRTVNLKSTLGSGT